ncbi:alpha/beta hydrolase [Microbacterium deminutum]
MSGCLYSQIPEAAPRSTESKAPDTTAVDSGLLPFYEQKLDWSVCHKTFECTTVRTPLDWSDPARGDIQLAVIRHRADSGHAIGSLLTNPGGPGASGIPYVRDSLDFFVGDLRASYDVIGFDPRGVGKSTAVKCYDAAEMDSYLFDIPAAARGSKAWTDEVTHSNRAYVHACDANSHGILPYISTENAARDMDLLRAVLGDRKLNYLGYSWGSLLGATYAKLFPERVGRLVLDGGIDPSVSLLDSAVGQGIGFESALRAYMSDCLAGNDCPFRGSVDEALADLGTLLSSVERDPLPSSDGRMLGASSLTQAIVEALYVKASWPTLTVALGNALAGNPDVAFLLADSYYRRQDGRYVDSLLEPFWAYTCMDYPHDATADQKAQAQAVLDEKAPTIAPYWFAPDPCAVWPYPATGVPGPIHAQGAAPIVVIGTTNDPATPYKEAVALADQLSSGVLITRVGEGHTGYNKGNKCVDRAVVNYFVDGTVPEDGLRCG